MSKHSLYRKDLRNHTLARTLLFVVTQWIACLLVLIHAIPTVEAGGPLSVKKSNPRYFFDSRGNSVYLTGSYLNEYNLLTGSSDFASYLDFLQQQKQNFTRVWAWEQSPWSYDVTGQVTFSAQPYERTGPGLALDGGLKFDLTRFNQVYFDQLRSRVVEASRRGLYVSVALFEGFSTQKRMGRVNPWLSDPFQQANNINGINGDPDRNGSNEEFFSLAFPSLVSLQETFTRKIVDTLNDLDNVLYEVSGNGLVGSLPWQYHMMDHIKRYQKKQVNQHPVGISDFDAGATADVFNSSADWIIIQETNLNPPSATSNKVLIMERTLVSTGEQTLSTSPISLFQLLPDTASSQNSGISNSLPTSNGVPSSSSATPSSTSNSTTSSSKNQPSQVATPTITPNGGVYSGTVPVTLQTSTPGTSIYYTTDGQSPTQSSSLYTGKFKLAGSTLVKAKAFKNNLQPSSEASAWFANTEAVSAPGLLAHWNFDEGSGTVVNDASGNGNAGTLLNGPTWTTGIKGTALSLDGVDDYVDLGSSPSMNISGTAITVQAWIKANSPGNYKYIVSKTDALYMGYGLYTGSSGTLRFYVGNGTGLILTPDVNSPWDNQWHHFAGTYDGSKLNLYIDGMVRASAAATGNIADSGSRPLNIGQFSEGGFSFKGVIDDVQIYNRTLSATEIQTLYQQAAPSQTVANPVLSPNGGNYSGSVSVTMQTATSGASIYYTTDGSTPTQSSTLYSGAIILTNSTTVKAKAFKSGSNASTEASASFTVTQPFGFSVASAGNISVVAGSSVTNLISTTLASGTSQAVTISASGLPAGATASFSSTSCSPSCSSMLTINTSSSTPAGSSNITVTATGGGISKTTAFSLTVSLPTVNAVATPTITPNGGSFTSSVSVTMQTTTAGASIYYTTDGSTPTQLSTLYSGAMNFTNSATVKAKAFKSGSNASAEASASFTVSQPFSFSVANSGNTSVVAGSSVTNLISTTLASGTAQAITFSASGLPTGATASFSSTSCSPSCSSTLTISTSSSTPAGSSNITVTATGGGVSKTATFSLTVSLPTVATPAINPNGGNYTGSAFVAMQTATAGASIFYTTDGSTPTQSSTLYTGAMTLTNSATVKAKAFKSGSNASAEASASFVVSQPAPTITVDSTFLGYTALPIHDGIINASGGTSSTWASEETATDHWINVTFPSPRQINSAIIHWAFNNYQKAYMTAQSVNIQYWNGSSYQSISSLVYPGSNVSSSSASFATVTTSQLRFLMPAAQGNPGYPNVFWVTELDYGLDIVAPTAAAPTITPNGGSFSGSVSVTIQSTTSGASIYYTTDGSTPTQSSTLYTGPMTLTSSAAIMTMAFKSGSNPSAVANASFSVSQTTSISQTMSGSQTTSVSQTTGNVYYVAKTGANSNSCSQARSESTPKLTIAAGLACMAGGDTLIIKSGTYNEYIGYNQLVSGTSDSSRTIVRSYPGDTVILRPTGGTLDGAGSLIGDVIWVYGKQYITFDGLIVDAINAARMPVFINDDSMYITVQNSELMNSHDDTPCIEPAPANYTLIANNKIHNCGTSSGPLFGYGVYIRGNNNIVEHNDIYNAQGWCVHEYSNNPGSIYNTTVRYNVCRDSGNGILQGGGANNVAHHNIITRVKGTADGALGIGMAVMYGNATNNQIYNNTMYGGNGFCMLIQSATNTQVKNNLCLSNGNNTILDLATATTTANNRLSTDTTLLIDAANNNFAPRQNSTLIDAGQIIPGFSSGTYVGAAPDIGAVEFGATNSQIN